MASEFLPLWAPDARAFKRATYMASTDDVELLGTVRDDGVEEESEDGNVLRHPAGRSTTPFGKHDVDPKSQEVSSEPHTLEMASVQPTASEIGSGARFDGTRRRRFRRDWGRDRN